MLRPKCAMQKAKTSRISGAWLLLCVCAVYFLTPCFPAVAQIRAPLPVPPEPMPARATVKRGDTVRILLRIYGAANQRLRYRVKTKPVAGNISEPENVTNETAAVTYTHSGKAEPVRDHFSFAVQSNAGVSAPADVEIAITDDPPILAVPDALNFGNVVPGTTAERQIALENQGGGLAEGRLETNDMWRIRGDGHYRMEHGEKQEFTVIFTPKSEYEYRGEIRYSGNTDRVTLLNGIGAQPFAVRPAALDLAARQNQAIRLGILEIENRTEEARHAVVEVGTNLRVSPTNMEIPANGKVQLPVEAAEGAERSAFQDALKIRVGNATFDVPVHAAALGPILRANAEKAWLGSAGPAAAATLQVENAGGTATVVRAEIGEPFQIAGTDKTFPLDPGEKHLIHLSLQSREAGRYQQRLRVSAAGNQLEIPVEGESGGSENFAANPAAAPVPAPSHPGAEHQVNAYAPQPLVDPRRALASFVLPFTVHVKSVSARAAEVEWAARSGDEKRNFRIERRILSIDARRALKIDWLPVKDVTITQTADVISARLQNLAPGTLHSFRLLADSPGTSPESLAEFQVWTSAPGKMHFRGIIVAALLAFLAFIAWRRFVR